MQYGPCAESQSFLGDMRDCMDSVCGESQCMGYVFSFYINKDVDTDVNATQDIISVHMQFENICNLREERTSC